MQNAGMQNAESLGGIFLQNMSCGDVFRRDRRHRLVCGIEICLNAKYFIKKFTPPNLQFASGVIGSSEKFGKIRMQECRIIG